MSEEFHLEAILAIAGNNGIGFKGKLPWNIPSELALFKSITREYPLIMGRATFESLPGILPNRHHIVISSSINDSHKRISVVTSVQEAIECARSLQSKKAFVIGGVQVFNEALTQCSILHRTRIHAHPEADTFLTINEQEWELVSSKEFVDVQTEIGFTYEVLKRNH